MKIKYEESKNDVIVFSFVAEEVEKQKFIGPELQQEKGKEISVLPSNEDGLTLVKPKKISRRYLGILLALLASITGPLAPVVVKALKEYHPVTLVSWRFTGMLIPSIPIALFHWLYKKENIFAQELGKGKTLALLLLRATLGTTGVLCLYTAIQYITVGDCIAISSAKPFFVLVFAYFSLGEKCGVIPTIAGLCAIVGVFVLARPPLLTGKTEFDQMQLKGTLFAVAVLICMTATNILLRHLRTVHYAMMSLSHATICTIATISAAFAMGKLELPRTLEDWGLAIAMSVFAVITQNLQNLAFKFEDASVTSLVRSSSIVFSNCWQWIIFGVIPDEFSIIGAVIIMMAVFIIGFRKYVSNTIPQDKLRQQCSCILV